MPDLKSGFQYVDDSEILLPKIKNMIFLGDVACTCFLEPSRKVVSRILEMETDLFLILGDISLLGEKEEFEEIIEFCNSRATAPIFSLRGNHDGRNFSQFLGLRTYALILDQFVVLALDNAMGVFEQDSLTFTEQMLKKHPEKRFVVTFHIPPPTDLFPDYMKPAEWEKLTDILDQHKNRIEYILTGHIHGFQDYRLDGYRVIISGGGGAALYDLEKDTLKSHHAIKATFKDDGTAELDVIPV